MRVFLSYASEAKSKAEPIAFSLRARGHKVFLDKDDLPPGNSYEEQIEQAIKASDVFLFLITGDSLARGRFTQTELAWARKKWPVADGHVLPVLLDGAAMAEVPSYLKSVTVLNPQGNVAAEVSAAVDDLAKGLPTTTIVPLMAGLGLASGLACAFLPNFLPEFDLGGIALLNMRDVPLQVGPLFALALVLGLRYCEKVSVPRMLAMLLTVTLAWLVAVNVAFYTNALDKSSPAYQLLEQEKADAAPAPDGKVDANPRQADTEARETIDFVFNAYSTAVGLLAGGVAGFLGSLLCFAGVRIATPRVSRWSTALLTVFAGGILGLVFFYASTRGQGYHFGLLYATWQPGVAAALGYGLSRPLR